MKNTPYQKYFALALLGVLLVGIAWWVLREQFVFLMSGYGLSYGIYLWLIRRDVSDDVVFYFGILVRVSIVFALPLLSNDVYRFIWDGRLLVAGENPFALRPSEWLALAHPPNGIHSELHDLIYADNYTVYPPVHQAVFWLSARFSTSILGSVLILKSALVLADVGLLWLLRKLKRMGWWQRLFVIYALNPLVVLEIAGNGHFEGLMVLFLVLGIVGLRKNDVRLAGLGWGLAIATKLLPLMLLPLVWRYFSKGKWASFLRFLGWILLVNVVLWLPMIRMGSLGHLMDSIWLYFESFEFNASVYYVLKWLIPQGWRIGLITNGLTILVIGYWAFRQKAKDWEQLMVNMAWVWLIYLLDSAIVHPWYVIPVLVLSEMAGKRYGLVWAGLIYLSYSHYWMGGMSEHFWLIGLEYALLGYFVVSTNRRILSKNLG